MTKGYKLTAQNMQTYNGFRWKLGKTYKTSGEGYLCSPGWLHYYEHPLLALFHNPMHANFSNPRLFEAAVGKTIKKDRQLKAGTTSLRLVKELSITITITTEQRIRYAIACALSVYKEKSFRVWAENWINEKDRSESAARAAYAAARAAARAAYAADAAADAADAAADAAYAAADAAYAAYAAAYAADAAYAAYAAYAAANANAADLDLIPLAEWAVSDSLELPKECQ